MRNLVSIALSAILTVGLALDPSLARAQSPTVTPITHLVVIFGENISFDHYYGTYPYAENVPGEPRFRALPGTPSVNGLSNALLTSNPNFLNTAANGNGAANPFRLDRTQALTADMNHDYGAEQSAFHAGLMDQFPMATGAAGPPPAAGPPVIFTNGLVMGYYDGNTVTALWNYAQHFALADNAFGTTFGPSTVGALNLISGQTNGVIAALNGYGSEVPDGQGGYTVIGDPDPLYDVCSASTRNQVQMGGQNIGDLLNAAGVSWGWFQGGFNLNIKNPNGTTGCSRSSSSPFVKVTANDYSPHHQPFQYYASTANPKHLRPTSIDLIGREGDAANHQYDIDDFYTAVKAGNFPAVSFLKAREIEDAHPGYSDPLDEQKFIVDVVNFLMTQPEWKHTAVVIAYDDSDGWYDHVMGPIVNHSQTSADSLTANGACGDGTTALDGPFAAHVQGRCGHGPRIPITVISPYAKRNYVDHTVLDQTSILRFVEDNWLGGQRITGSYDTLANSITSMFDFRNVQAPSVYLLNDVTGQPLEHSEQ
ncbi:MAG TPA: alkaline phosphatase family protein [Bryobacteraceae bacterium]|jgi:phospholipase C|nr:alkaline phosphatase family protein [Bryobacteraceae bacterium]